MNRICAVLLLVLALTASPVFAFSHRGAMSNGGYCDTPESKEQLRCKAQWEKKNAEAAAKKKAAANIPHEDLSPSSQTPSISPKPPHN